MQMWQPGSCYPLSLLFKILLTLRPPVIAATRWITAEADFLSLCEDKVLRIEALINANGGILLNKRQCVDLSTKLSRAVKNIRELASQHSSTASSASTTVFRPALENLFRILEKANLLVSDCCQEDWCNSSVYQIQNEKAFQEILLDLGLCYSTIYEHAEEYYCSSEELQTYLPVEDLRRNSDTFQNASAADIEEDHQMLQSRLEEIARQPHSTRVSVLDCFLPRSLCLKQHLAQYLLQKVIGASTGHYSHGKGRGYLRSPSEILWKGDTEPSGTWGNARFLGKGSGAHGVLSTSWLGIPCAKKVFQGINGSLFTKEAGILADLNHPHVVKFLCCGTGGTGQDNYQKESNAFIAMELMEMSLEDLINERKKQKKPFSLHVAMDIIMQIARGMCYLHEVKVAHRDLKPLNVVVNRLSYNPHLEEDYFCVKLVDFGLSKTKVEVHKAHTMSYCGLGTTLYRAPEVFQKAHLDGEPKNWKAEWFKADVYSFAVTCAQILTLQQPYEHIPRHSVLYEELIKGVRPEIGKECPVELVSLLNACWHKTPSERPHFKAICSRLEDFNHKVIRLQMRVGEPKVPVQNPLTVARTDHDNGVDKEIQPLQDLGTGASTPATPSAGGEKAKASSSSDGNNSSSANKIRRGKSHVNNNNPGVEKLQQTREVKKKVTTPETPVSQGKICGNHWRKPKGRKIDFNASTPASEPMRVNSQPEKRGKRKQARDDDDATTTTPVGSIKPLQIESIRNSEKRKRRWKDGQKKDAVGVKLEDLFARTLSENRGAFRFLNEEHVDQIMSVLRSVPAAAVPPAAVPPAAVLTAVPAATVPPAAVLTAVPAAAVKSKSRVRKCRRNYSGKGSSI